MSCSVFILPRVLRDVSNVDTSTRVFDWTSSLPFGVAPSAMHKLAGGEGEMDMARACCDCKVNMTLSSQSTTTLEDVITVNVPEAKSPPFWFQIYLTADLDKSISMIKRAECTSQIYVEAIDEH